MSHFIEHLAESFLAQQSQPTGQQGGNNQLLKIDLSIDLFCHDDDDYDGKLSRDKTDTMS